MAAKSRQLALQLIKDRFKRNLQPVNNKNRATHQKIKNRKKQCKNAIIALLIMLISCELGLLWRNCDCAVMALC
jgi:hypothetical protein